MKVVQIADIHGDILSLEAALTVLGKEVGLENIDAFAFCGDILGPLYTKKEAQTLSKLTKAFDTLAPEDAGSLFEFVNSLTGTPALKESPEQYLTLHNKAVAYSEKFYGAFKKIMEARKVPSDKVLVVPGNWDSSLIFTELKDNILLPGKAALRTLPSRTPSEQEEGESLTFTGYGSAMETVPGTMPQDLLIGFDSQSAFRLLTESEGHEDIAITHEVPYRACPLPKNHKHPGSMALRDYLFTSKPSLLLCGHLHSPIAVTIPTSKDTCSYIIGAANLGRYKRFREVEAPVLGDSGFFNVIDLDRNSFPASFTAYQIALKPDKTITSQKSTYNIDEKGNIRESK